MMFQRNLLHTGFLLGLFFNLEDGNNTSSIISVDFQWTIWRYIPEGRSLHPYLFLPVEGDIAIPQNVVIIF
jgi:hypothetical protein